MTYTVFYRRPWWPFWRKFKRVKGDSLQYDQRMNAAADIRVLYLLDDTRVELPAGILVIKFSPGRNLVIEQNKQKEIATGGARS